MKGDTFSYSDCKSSLAFSPSSPPFGHSPSKSLSNKELLRKQPPRWQQQRLTSYIALLSYTRALFLILPITILSSRHTSATLPPLSVVSDQVRLDSEINVLRSNLKVKVNTLREKEGRPELKGFGLRALGREEISAVRQVIGPAPTWR